LVGLYQKITKKIKIKFMKLTKHLWNSQM